MKFYDKIRPWKRDEIEKVLLKAPNYNILKSILFAASFIISIFIAFVMIFVTSIIIFALITQFSFILTAVFLFFLFTSICYIYLSKITLIMTIENLYVTYWYRKNSKRKNSILANIFRKAMPIDNLKDQDMDSIRKASTFIFNEIVNEKDRNFNQVYEFMKKVLNEELPIIILFSKDKTKSISNELMKIIEKLEKGNDIKSLYSNLFEIHKIFKKSFDTDEIKIKERGGISHILSNNIVRVIIIFIISYLIYLFLTNALGWYDIKEFEIVDNNNITQYYFYDMGVNNIGIMNIEKFDMALPPGAFETTIRQSDLVSNCQIIDEKNLHCDIIYKNGYIFISWKNLIDLSNNPIFWTYQTSNTKIIPLFILPKIEKQGTLNPSKNGIVL